MIAIDLLIYFADLIWCNISNPEMFHTGMLNNSNSILFIFIMKLHFTSWLFKHRLPNS